MVIGLIGSGNMARAMARGWGEPVLCTDVLAERAAALAAAVGGEALATNAELAERADVVVLCHKPPALEAVAAEVAPRARAVVSILGATPLAAVRAAYPGIPAFRFLPSTPVAVGEGMVCYVPAPAEDPRLEAVVLELFGRLGTVVPIEESLIDVAMGLMSCGPAFVALVVEAQVDAATRHGMAPAQAAELVTGTLSGTAALLRAREMDTLGVRREVTSPGGSTARGLDALERGGLRAAFGDALDAVLGSGRR